MNITRENGSKASLYLKETAALLGLFVTVYVWSLVALALQG